MKNADQQLALRDTLADAYAEVLSAGDRGDTSSEDSHQEIIKDIIDGSDLPYPLVDRISMDALLKATQAHNLNRLIQSQKEKLL